MDLKVSVDRKVLQVPLVIQDILDRQVPRDHEVMSVHPVETE